MSIHSGPGSNYYYRKGCRCPECREASREERRLKRATAAAKLREPLPRVSLDLSWQARAACKGLPLEGTFFNGSSAGDWNRDPEKNLPGLAVCGGCEVREPCLDFALRTRAEFGVFGGLTSKQRRKLLRVSDSVPSPS